MGVWRPIGRELVHVHVHLHYVRSTVSAPYALLATVQAAAPKRVWMEGCQWLAGLGRLRWGMWDGGSNLVSGFCLTVFLLDLHHRRDSL